MITKIEFQNTVIRKISYRSFCRYCSSAVCIKVSPLIDISWPNNVSKIKIKQIYVMKIARHASSFLVCLLCICYMHLFINGATDEKKKIRKGYKEIKTPIFLQIAYFNNLPLHSRETSYLWYWWCTWLGGVMKTPIFPQLVNLIT